MEDAEQIIKVPELAKVFLKRVKADKDVALGISGYEGDGKSTLAVNILIETLLEQGKSEEEILANFDNYMIYSPNKDEMFKKITRPEKYAPINSDEAVKALYKLNWASTSQKFLNMLFQLCRKENKINILCIPRFTDLNEYFRNHRIMFWIHILETGTAVLMIRDWSPFSKDPWYLDENKKIIDLIRKKRKVGDIDLQQKINLMKKTRGFIAIVQWDDLTTKFKNVYKKGKEENSYGGMDDAGNIEVGDRAEMYKDRLLSAVRNLKDKGFTSQQIADITNCPVRTVRTYMKSVEAEVNTTNIYNNQVTDENFEDSKGEDNK